jgi:hypothetical protein
VLLVLTALPLAAQSVECKRTITANVSAFDQPFLVNRLGAMMVEGMVYALDRDTVPVTSCPAGTWCPRARLRDGKRARPLVLRANVGDCLSIHFSNLLADTPAPYNTGVQPATRSASIHVAGMQLVKSIRDDGSNVGVNASSTIAPGQTITYVLRATQEGTYLLNSEGAPFGGLNLPNDGAQVSAGLFGGVNVEPEQSVWFRSQITHDEMMQAKTGETSLHQPLLNFDAPVLNILQNNEIVHSDLTAVIAGPKSNHYQFLDNGDPNTAPVPYEPKRKEPFREFTIEYHELNDTQQAFPIFDYKNATLTQTLQPSGDEFAINFGSGGIGAEILANRFGLGPMGSCTDCKFEEFFLSSWTVGDPASIVDYPANAPCSGTTFTSPPAVTNSAAPAANCTPGVKANAPPNIQPLRKATMVRYPDDPSNVYHSYINDRVVFRTLHAGTGVSHVHHLHAHQWFHSPNADGSTYLDSQLINPGSAYTQEIAHLGSGNLNKVVGDSIFHCHFYPHFAAGMWAMWRSHDVFESGTELDANGVAKTGWNRAQPDGEIANGTPIPALLPMPSLAMAPMPARVQIVAVTDVNNPGGPVIGYRSETNQADLDAGLNPGYPFFIPGVGGTRAPHPPLDFAVDKGKELNGGLPRHMILNATVTNEQHTYLNFSKDLDNINAYQLPEDGTNVEKVAMAYHAQCTHPTFTTDGTPAKYRTNGLPPAHGAPFADPGLMESSDKDTCTPIREWTEYRAAVIQRDIVFNKVGWHYPQARFLTLWSDVMPTMRGEAAPEPFFIRANSHTGVNYWHTNLVPDYYLLDDFQVRTPTDIIGQHIHLVKFDVTSSDGAANGFNYEDGTLSYDDVRAQIKAINDCGGLASSFDTITKCGQAGSRKNLAPELPPAEICKPEDHQCQEWSGAQTTVQRWYADPIPDGGDPKGGERTLRSVFTHDHFGPSTHQQTGLYAALLVEPRNSKWYLNEPNKTTGVKIPMHTRPDGGPTSWQAVIETPNTDNPHNIYREFSIALQDFALAYQAQSQSAAAPVTGTQTEKDGTTTSAPGGPSWASQGSVAGTAISYAIESQVNLSNPAIKSPIRPMIVSAGPTQGTSTFNYRNEPLPYRVQPGASTDARATDLSYVFSSTAPRNNTAFQSQPVPGTPISAGSAFRFAPTLTNGVQAGDPYTPLLRGYEGDWTQVRVIVGAHMLPHDFNIAGVKWWFEPSFANSGYRSNQSLGISEHFEFLFNIPRASPSAVAGHPWADYLYVPDASNQNHGIVDGMWGLMRAYQTNQKDLVHLSTNASIAPLPKPTLKSGYSCPPAAPVRAFSVSATNPGTVTFNSRGVGPMGKFPLSQITNPFQLMYQYLGTTVPGGAPQSVTPNTTEPLILRANAGECVAVTLRNDFTTTAPVFQATGGASTAAKFAPEIPLIASKSAGITPALMSYDVMASSGMNVGFNPEQTAAAQQSKTFYWYAGQTNVSKTGTITGDAMELAGVNLTPSDPMGQDMHGLAGGLIVEPANTVACVDIYNPQPSPVPRPMYASATVYDGKECNKGKLRYREFVMVTQDDLKNVSWPGGCYCAAPKPNAPPGDCAQNWCLTPVENAINGADLNPTLQTAINYRIEPMTYRFNATKFVNLTNVYRAQSDSFVLAEPQTPIFSAARHTPIRFHLLHPGGSGDQQVMALHGHVWQELPFVSKSTAIGDNTVSMHLGARDNYGANTAYPIIIEANGGAGGRDGVTGDYVYRTTPANFLTQGLWGLFRVGDSGSDAVRLASAQFSNGSLAIAGSSTVFLDIAANAKNGQRASTVSLYFRPKGTTGDGTKLSDVFVGDGGLWAYNVKQSGITNPEGDIVAVSPFGGRSEIELISTVLPATNADAQTPKPSRESIRFVNEPRPTFGTTDNANDTSPVPTQGLPAPPDDGVPQAEPREPYSPPPPPAPVPPQL